MIATWPCPIAEHRLVDEYALILDRGRARRLLIVPALFDEGNRLRRFTAETMRALDERGIDSILPDLPGTNESLSPLPGQSVPGWRRAMAAAANHFGATRVLAIRGGALLAPAGLPGWSYAGTSGEAILRQMIRARILASREAGREETQSGLLDAGQRDGLDLAGYTLSAGLVMDLHGARPAELGAISQADIGGPALWLRAEPDEDRAQSGALAGIIAGAWA